MTTIVLGRAVGSVSINGLEFLMDGPGKYKEFESKEAAKEFIRQEIFPDSTDEEIEDYFTFVSPEEAKDYTEITTEKEQSDETIG